MIFFDVFDTTIIRSLAAPSDVFRLVYRALSNSGKLPTILSEDAFSVARMQAETKALVGQEECTLREIWLNLSELLGTDLTNLRRTEIEVERRVCARSVSAYELIQEHRRSGKNVGFISDSYLPQSFISDLLYSEGLAKEGDCVFVSSEVGKTKRTGALYEHVCATLSLKPSDCMMIGDNRFSDVLMAKRRGWNSVYFARNEPSIYERRLLAERRGTRLSRSSLSGVVRKERLFQQNTTVEYLTNCFLGPASVLWALWVLRKADELGINRVYFMARDSYLALLCAREIANDFFPSITVKYFCGSRNSLHAAGTSSTTRESLRWVLRDWDEPRLSTVVRRLGLDIEDERLLRSTLKMPEGDLMNDDLLTSLFALLNKDPIQGRLLSRFSEKRWLAMRYAEQTGLTGHGKVAIVDVGWHLSVQSALNSIIQKSELLGLYLYLSPERAPASSAGHALSMFECQLPDTSPHMDIPQLRAHSTAVEHLLGLAPHGTTLGYQEDNGSVKPFFQDLTQEDRIFKASVGNAVTAYAKRNSHIFYQTCTGTDECASCFRAITDIFLSHPPKDLLTLLKDIRTSSDPVNDSISNLIRPLRFSDALRIAMPARLQFQIPSLVWRAGCVEISSLFVRSFLGARRTIDRIRGLGR